jgi:hypothetical protein
LRAEKFELVVSSPLTRALQTATVILGNRGIPSVILPQVAEYRIHGSACDFGRPASKISEGKAFFQLENSTCKNFLISIFHVCPNSGVLSFLV